MYKFEVKEQGRKQTISYVRKEAISFAHQIGIDFENDTEYRWFLNQALQCTLPLGWKKEYDPLGLIQYHNTGTNTVTDKHPLLFKFRKAFALLSSQKKMDHMSYEAQNAAFLNLISSLHSKENSENDVEAFTYYERLLNNSPETSSHILESLDYQLVDPQQMLEAAEELTVRHDYRYMWLARMLVVLPLPPLWTVEDNEGERVYQSPALVPWATHPAVPYLRSLIRKGGFAKKSFLMEFHDKNFCKFQVDLRRLVGGIDYVIYKEIEPDPALHHLVPEKSLSTQEQNEKLIVFEILNAIGIDVKKEVHMVIGAFAYLDRLHKGHEFKDWEFRFTSEGKSYWYNNRSKQAMKIPPFKKQAAEFLKQYRITSLNKAKELVKSYMQRHTLFEINGKPLFQKAREEAIGIVKILIDKHTDSDYEFVHVSDLIKKQFQAIDEEKLLNFLFAIPFKINLSKEEPKPFWEETSEEISTHRMNRMDPIVRQERSIYRMKTINESQFSVLERQSRYLRSKSIIEDVSDEDDEMQGNLSFDNEESGFIELDSSPIGKYSEIQKKIQVEERKDFMSAIQKHLENESNGVSLSKIKENLSASRVSSPITIFNQIREASNENSEVSGSSERVSPNLQIEIDSSSPIKGEELSGFADISPIAKMMSVEEFASYSATSDFKIELTKTMSNEELDSTKEKKISLEIPDRRIFRFESFEDKNKLYEIKRNLRDDDIIEQDLEEEEEEELEIKPIKMTSKLENEAYFTNNQTPNKKIEIYLDETYRINEVTKVNNVITDDKTSMVKHNIDDINENRTNNQLEKTDTKNMIGMHEENNIKEPSDHERNTEIATLGGNNTKESRENKQVPLIEFPVDLHYNNRKLFSLNEMKSETKSNLEKEILPSNQEKAGKIQKTSSVPRTEPTEKKGKIIKSINFRQNSCNSPQTNEADHKFLRKAIETTGIEIKAKELTSVKTIKAPENDREQLQFSDDLSNLEDIKSLDEAYQNFQASIEIPQTRLLDSKFIRKSTQSDTTIPSNLISNIRSLQFLKSQSKEQYHFLRSSTEKNIAKSTIAKETTTENFNPKNQSSKRPKTTLTQPLIIKSFQGQAKINRFRQNDTKKQLSQVEIGSSVPPKTAAGSRDFKKSSIFKLKKRKSMPNLNTNKRIAKTNSNSSNRKKKPATDNKKQIFSLNESIRHTPLSNTDLSIASPWLSFRKESKCSTPKLNESVLNHSKLVLNLKKSPENYFEYFCQIIGHPYSGIDLLRFTEKSVNFTPSDVVNTGLKLGLNVSHEPFKSPESDFLWIPYLQLAVQAPSFQDEDRDSYFIILLEFHRKRKAMQDLPIQRLIELSWLKFQRKDGKRYFFNFFTHEKMESLIKKKKSSKFSKFYMT